MEPLIRINNLRYAYQEGSGKIIPALNGVDLAIQEGEFLAIIGANGSGKSTLARHFNALLLPTEGEVYVNSVNTRYPSNWPEIRRKIAMVFQHPESQMVATTIEEDVAFGPENLGVPPAEIRRRVDWALDSVGLTGMHKRAPHHLSGGQKQRLALAGALAMQPRCIVLDEATSMLDPSGRRGLREIVKRLHAQGVTIVMITQDMDEAAIAERVIVLSQGRVARDDSSRKVMTDEKFLQSVDLDMPPMAWLAQELHACQPSFPSDLLTVDEMIAQVGRFSTNERGGNAGHAGKKKPSIPHPQDGTVSRELQQSIALADKSIIDARGLWYTYMRGTALETVALRGVDFSVRSGEIIGLIGATGSGKSTLLQHLNGLLLPQAGRLRIAEVDITKKQSNMRAIRQQVALLFQHPEDQLFERYVADDVAYGPINLGLPLNDVRQRVIRAMDAVGLSLDVFRDRSIYSLSGGERKRAALAGVLALEPKVLVLDEASAGLDPRGRRELLGFLRNWQAQEGMSIVWASHSMEEIAQIARRVVVLADGQVMLDGTPQEVFYKPEVLATYGLDVPQVVQLMSGLAHLGMDLPQDVLTFEEAVLALDKILA
jgi:energy-coupling factor transport system ATP-binding protein